MQPPYNEMEVNGFYTINFEDDRIKKLQRKPHFIRKKGEYHVFYTN